MKKGLAKRPFFHCPNGRSDSVAKALQAGILEVGRYLLRLAAEIPVNIKGSDPFIDPFILCWKKY